MPYEIVRSDPVPEVDGDSVAAAAAARADCVEKLTKKAAELADLGLIAGEPELVIGDPSWPDVAPGQPPACVIQGHVAY